MNSPKFYLYILLCSDQSYYTGITTDLEKRVKMHNGEIPWGAKYTSGRRPVRLVYSEICENRSDASKREIQVKKLSRKKKEEMIFRKM